MAEVIQLNPAQLMAGPPTASDGSVFPAGNTVIPLDTTPAQKPYAVSTGRQLVSVNSPNALTPLVGLGPQGSVTQAHTVYIRTGAPFVFEFTYAGSDSAPKLRYVMGMLIEEVDPSRPIILLRAQGTGAVEYLAVGNQ